MKVLKMGYKNVLLTCMIFGILQAAEDFSSLDPLSITSQLSSNEIAEALCFVTDKEEDSISIEPAKIVFAKRVASLRAAAVIRAAVVGNSDTEDPGGQDGECEDSYFFEKRKKLSVNLNKKIRKRESLAEPKRDDFETEEAFREEYDAWRKKRDKNNEAVRKHRLLRPGKQRKRNRSKPKRDDFEAESDYLKEYLEWKKCRDKNNEAVRKYRLCNR
jgi:hypothetical protein